MILRALTDFPLAAHLFKQTPPENGQVADVVAGVEVIGRIVRLEMRDMRGARFFAEERFVGVEEIGPGFGRGPPHAENRVRGQNVVMVGKGEVFTGRKFGRGVCVGRDAAVFDAVVEDAVIGRRAGRCDLADIRMRFVRGVDQHKLPARAGLGRDAVEKRFEIRFRRVVERGQDADDREIAAVGFPLGGQRRFGRPVPRPLAEQPAPKKAGRPPQHRPGPLFPRQGSRIAEQLAHTFHLQIHERFSFGMGMWMGM